MVAPSARSLVPALLVVVVLGPVFGATVPGGASAPTAAGPGAHASALVELQTDPETDNTITRIAVHENGSATWTLQIRTRLETDEAETEYRAFQDRFRENTSRYVDDFQASITGIVGNAREVTDREMDASGFRASTSIQTVPRRWGIVTFEFRWDGFAADDGDRLRVGDVFEGGLFIAEGDSLEVVAPDGYRIEAADPAPDESEDGAVTWLGREDFADRRPQVVIAPVEPDEAGGLPWRALGSGAAVLGLAALAGLGYWRRRAGRAGAGGSDGAAGGGEGPVLADEDRVRRLLTERGGRMRQQAVAEELDWSRSKTSRVLGRMADEEQIEKLRLGRENVIALPEETGGG